MHKIPPPPPPYIRDQKLPVLKTQNVKTVYKQVQTRPFDVPKQSCYWKYMTVSSNKFREAKPAAYKHARSPKAKGFGILGGGGGGMLETEACSLAYTATRRAHKCE